MYVYFPRLCSNYFATPLSALVGKTGTPPDVVTSFANLALGAIFNAKIRREEGTDKQVFAVRFIIGCLRKFLPL